MSTIEKLALLINRYLITRFFNVEVKGTSQGKDLDLPTENNNNIQGIIIIPKYYSIISPSRFGYAADINDQPRAQIKYLFKYVRKHRFTPYSLTLLIRWDTIMTRPQRDWTQEQRLNVFSEARGFQDR